MKLTAMLMILLLTLTMLPAGAVAEDEKVNVIATIFAPFDFARVIAGGRANVSMLVPPAAESHSFEPTPQDIIRIQNNDVFIHVGGESDVWVEGILASMDTDDMIILAIMDSVELKEEEIVEGMDADHDHGHDYDDHGHNHDRDHEEDFDEHVWTSPRNAKLIVTDIAEALMQADPANAQFYGANLNDYLIQLDALDAAFQDVVADGIRDTIVFGDRFPFRYFVDAYGLHYFAAFPGCSTETEPSAQTIAFLIDKVRDESIPVIFHAELSNGKIAEIISESTGAVVRLLHAAHNISKADFESGKTYLELMWGNVEALREALS